MQPCAAGRLSQMLAYNRDLTIVLVSSKTAAMPLGMCLDAAPATQRGAVVEFRPCGTSTLPRQQWSINDSANFQGTTNGSSLNGLCFNVQRPDVVGSFVVLGSCGGPYNNTWTFSADAAVGAGAAGKDAGQLVNFSQFGRCMDVTKHDLNYPYMIIWPCKQAPDPTKVSWNQKWTIKPVDAANPAKGMLITTTPSVPYCLRSPGSTRAGAYVTVAKCGTAPTADLIWKVSGDTGNYATSYVAVDYNGLCLAATDPKAKPADLHFEGEQVSKSVVGVCDGSTLQKWNAPANILQTLPLKDISEK
jgi:hypothetical protein